MTVNGSALRDDNDEESSKGTSCQSSGHHEGLSTAESTQTGHSDEEINAIKETLAREETKAVFRLRVLVILILLAAATAVSTTVLLITKRAEKEDFENQYFGVADKIIQVFQDVMVEISAVSGIAVAESADSLKQKQPWPFVSMSNFQERAGNARQLSGAIYVSVNPVVRPYQLSAWEKYVLREHGWINEGIRFQEEQGLNGFSDPDVIDKSWLTRSPVDPLHTFDASGWSKLSDSQGPFLPRWQTSPVLLTSMVNENLLEKPHVAAIAQDCIDTKSAVLGGFVTAPAGSTSHPDQTTSFFATLLSMSAGKQTQYNGDPISHLTIPIFDALNGTDREVVGVLMSTIHWQTYLTDVLPSTVRGITVVIENACDGSFTYEVDGTKASTVGEGDLHDQTFHEYHVDGRFTTETIKDGTITGINLNQDGCPYTFHVYPTQKYHDELITSDPVKICCAIAAVFLFTILMFLTYDRLVERRQRLVLAKATHSTAIVSSLFPKQVRDRLMEVQKDKAKRNSMLAPSHRLKSFMSGTSQTEPTSSTDQPIADLFPHCTVFFADIAGFTAWSSTREPSQVFILLQAVYQAFDTIAKRRRVFKVETIGDSYLAVTGLPEPQQNHAVIMAKFAWESLLSMAEVTKSLEVQLGPDTGDLDMRVGLHSGPVTAGVLKGDRARFQLFGDTVNTAARMESTGRKGKIQISQSTAELLRLARKDSWITAREDSVEAKGKGVLKTFWLALRHSANSSSETSSSEAFSEKFPGAVVDEVLEDDVQNRLVNWIVDILVDHIKKIVAVRQRRGKPTNIDGKMRYMGREGKICLDEVKEVINMPSFDATTALAYHNAKEVDVPNDVLGQLKKYVALIANSYRNNPFHNFEHACHVTMSVNKLTTRIVTPDLDSTGASNIEQGTQEIAAQIHDFTHGITSDPMAVFAITFSALIHDVDHQGISNEQLAKEEPKMGNHYRNKSVAEQNSLDVAWDILMAEEFLKLRQYIFCTKVEMMRFRQLIVNIVLATDIFDKELNDLRRGRWERAFHGDSSIHNKLVRDYRATIVMEHIIQASDVSHTMQHWHIYQKWNRKLFIELRQAHLQGRMGANPVDFWYEGELRFFDNYVIPLAKKLQECNVFGVSSDEYLNYALRNRAEWEERGHELVKSMVSNLEDSDESAGLDMV